LSKTDVQAQQAGIKDVTFKRQSAACRLLYRQCSYGDLVYLLAGAA